MNVKEYGEREKKLVEHFGSVKIWDFNQRVFGLLEKKVSHSA
ncbi:hypothetical protein ACLBXI_07915 [Bacillus cereus]|nr:hypothetical protein [Bacillus cereus]